MFPVGEEVLSVLQIDQNTSLFLTLWDKELLLSFLLLLSLLSLLHVAIMESFVILETLSLVCDVIALWVRS